MKGHSFIALESIAVEKCPGEMQPLDANTVSQSTEGESSVVVTSNNEPTIVENLSVNTIGPVYVYIVKEVNGEPEPLETTPSGGAKAFDPQDLPKVIAGVVEVIITSVDDNIIQPTDVSGQICSEGKTTTVEVLLQCIVRMVVCA